MCHLSSGAAGVRSGPAGVRSGPAGVRSRPAGVRSGPADVRSGPAGVRSGASGVPYLPHQPCYRRTAKHTVQAGPHAHGDTTASSHHQQPRTDLAFHLPRALLRDRSQSQGCQHLQPTLLCNSARRGAAGCRKCAQQMACTHPSAMYFSLHTMHTCQLRLWCCRAGRHLL